MDKLAAMESDLKANTLKKETLAADIELCGIKLQRAEKLIGGLGGEKARWQDTADTLAKAQVGDAGYMLVPTSIEIYHGS